MWVQVRAKDAESPCPVKGAILKTKATHEDENEAKQGELREAELELDRILPEIHTAQACHQWDSIHSFHSLIQLELGLRLQATESFPEVTVGKSGAVREAFGSAVLWVGGPAEGGPQGRCRGVRVWGPVCDVGSPSDKEGLVSPGHSGHGMENLAAPGASPDTLPASIWPSLKFAGSTSHLPRSCEKHSTTFLRSVGFTHHTTRGTGHSSLLQPHKTHTHICRGQTHMHMLLSP